MQVFGIVANEVYATQRERKLPPQLGKQVCLRILRQQSRSGLYFSPFYLR